MFCALVDNNVRKCLLIENKQKKRNKKKCYTGHYTIDNIKLARTSIMFIDYIIIRYSCLPLRKRVIDARLVTTLFNLRHLIHVKQKIKTTKKLTKTYLKMNCF